MTPAGKLNCRVVIEQRTAGVDAYGQPVTTWSTLATLWANIISPTGKSSAEQLVADRQISAATYSVRIRYRTDITAAMRLTYGGAIYNIEQVILDLAGKRHVDLVCTVGESVG